MKNQQGIVALPLLIAVATLVLILVGGGWYYINSGRSRGEAESGVKIQNARIVRTVDIKPADRVVVIGHALFVAANAKLLMYDLTNPAQPTLIQSWDIDDARLDAISGDGNKLYGYDGDGFFRVDISDIKNPQYVRPETNNRPDVFDWIVRDGIVYSANNGLETYRDDIIPDTTFVGYGESDYSLKVAQSGQYAFVLDLYEGLVGFNVEQPEYPIRVGSINSPAYNVNNFDLTLLGSHAFVVLEKSGLKSIDISNPSLPKEVGTLADGLNARAITSAGHYVLIADGADGLKIIDVQNPAAPKLSATVDTPGEAVDVVVQGRYAYVADTNNGVAVIELGPNTLQSPTELQTSCTQEYRGYVYNEHKDRCGSVTIHACTDPKLAADEAACAPKVKKSPSVSSVDSDRDGLTDFQEVLYGTKTAAADTDGDGFNDLTEIQNFYNPLGPGPMKVELFQTYCRQYLNFGSPTGSYGADVVSPEEETKICVVLEGLWTNGDSPRSRLRADSGYQLFTMNGICEPAYDDSTDQTARSKELACNNIGSDIMLNFFNPQLATVGSPIGLSPDP